MFKPGSINGRCGPLQIQTREPIKNIWTASKFSKWLWLEMAKEDIVHIKNMQSNKVNIAESFDWKYSDVTPFVIINNFKTNCNLITNFF